ncbi:MAG: type II toxin-antitoxin system VapC family toxin [Streptosporangiaceae bacterium]
MPHHPGGQHLTPGAAGLPEIWVLNADDADHQRCADLLETHPGPLLVPGPVLAEVCYMAEARVGSAAEAGFLRSVASGELTLVELSSADLSRMAELVERYADLPLGAADASVVAVAERLGVREVATLDRRHFTVVRPSHVNALTLLPD